MKKNILIGVVSFLMLSCGDNKELSNIDYTPVSDCNVKVLKTVYVNKSSYYDGKGWHTSFSHILLLNGYKNYTRLFSFSNAAYNMDIEFFKEMCNYINLGNLLSESAMSSTLDLSEFKHKSSKKNIFTPFLEVLYLNALR